MMTDLYAIWPKDADFVPSDELRSKLVMHNAEFWGLASSYGKELTTKRMASLIVQASKITSQRPGGRGPRGYSRTVFAPVWHRLGVGRFSSGASGDTGASGADDNRMHRDNQVHRIETDTPGSGAEPGARTGADCPTCGNAIGSTGKCVPCIVAAVEGGAA